MISIIVPTYNEEKNIEKCLKALKNQRSVKDEYEIIVVDGNSTDKTVELAKKYADNVIFQKSKGIGGARNDGASVANGNIIATTDADCIVSEDWLMKIESKFSENKDIIGIYGRDLPAESKPISIFAFICLDIVKSGGNIFGFHGMSGTNSAFRKQHFLKVKGYRDIHYADDSEISIRLNGFGKIKYCRDMIVNVSTRRMEKYGHFNTFGLCIAGYFQNRLKMPMFNRKIEKEIYE